MKQISTKKVKTHPACAGGNDDLEEHFKPFQPHVKRRVRTRVTIIGLAISMGASSLLLTRQSDRALAESPVGNKPDRTVPAATVPAQDENITLVESYQVSTAALTPSNSPAKRPDLKTGKGLKIRLLNGIIHKTKAGKTSKTLWKSHVINPNAHTLLAATAADNQLQMGEPERDTGEVNALLKARQRLLISRLKQKSNRLEDSLTQLRYEGSNNLSAPATVSAESSIWEKRDVTVSPRSFSAAVEKTQTANKAIFAALVAGAPVRQQTSKRALEVVMGDDAVFDLKKLENTPSDDVVLSMPNSAVNEPTVVVPSALLSHQVKAGDTLTALARHHGISLSALVNANQLADPDKLQINQRITIPPFQSSSTSGKKVAVIKHLTKPEMVSSVAVPTLKAALSNPTPSFVPPLLLAANNSSVSVPTLPTTGLLQAKPKLIAHNSAVDTKQKSLAVPPEPLARTPVGKLPYGVGGDIPEEINELSPPSFNQSQLKKDSSPVPATALQPMTTVPVNVNAAESLQSVRGWQGFPQLPPLGTGDTYLPKPFDTSTPFKGYIWPAKGVLSSGYGKRWGRMHKGIDIAAPIGTPVVASAPGVVVKAGWTSGGFGKLVVLRHPDGALTRYAHNNRVLVQTGQPIEQGQVVAEMGSTGRSTGPHTHFELHQMGKGAVNPIAYLPR